MRAMLSRERSLVSSACTSCSMARSLRCRASSRLARVAVDTSSTSWCLRERLRYSSLHSISSKSFSFNALRRPKSMPDAPVPCMMAAVVSRSSARTASLPLSDLPPVRGQALDRPSPA
eukprot:scaffold1085_cov407-Prasinococcus_capsulatus_cf.AAC.88